MYHRHKLLDLTYMGSWNVYKQDFEIGRMEALDRIGLLYRTSGRTVSECYIKFACCLLINMSVLFQFRRSSQRSESTPTTATGQGDSVQEEGDNHALWWVLTQCDKEASRCGKGSCGGH
jgi:hypothetical protein